MRARFPIEYFWAFIRRTISPLVVAGWTRLPLRLVSSSSILNTSWSSSSPGFLPNTIRQGDRTMSLGPINATILRLPIPFNDCVILHRERTDLVCHSSLRNSASTDLRFLCRVFALETSRGNMIFWACVLAARLALNNARILPDKRSLRRTALIMVADAMV